MADHSEQKTEDPGTLSQLSGPQISALCVLAGGGRKVELWLAEQRVAVLAFADCRDRFINLNRPEDLERVRPLLSLPRRDG